MTTRKLFWEDPYLTECTAIVTEINVNVVKLDQTIFFAFSGGQATDSGTIGGINVSEAIKQGDKETVLDIEYVLEKQPDFKVGDEVIVKIDPIKRDKLRRLHSAVHILHYLFFDTIKRELECIGSNITEEKGRIDYLYEKPLTEHIPELEQKMNKFIVEDHKIERIKDPNKPELLYWICNNWKMPCGGTHIHSTKEIGTIKLKRKNIGSGKERFEVMLN